MIIEPVRQFWVLYDKETDLYFYDFRAIPFSAAKMLHLDGSAMNAERFPSEELALRCKESLFLEDTIDEDEIEYVKRMVPTQIEVTVRRIDR